MKRFLFILPLLIVVSSCSKDQSIITGIFSKGTDKEYIYLTKVEINEYLVIDSTKIKNDAFSFKTEVQEPTFFQVGFSTEEFVTVLASPGEKISLVFNEKVPNNNYTVSGSEGSKQVQTLDKKLYITRLRLDSIMDSYSKAITIEDNDDVVKALETDYEDAIKAQRRGNIEFIISNTTSFASIFALYQRYEDNSYVLYDTRDVQYLKIITDSLSKYYPNSKTIKSISTDLSREMNNLYSRQLENLVASAEETTLDPNLLDANGKRVALSSLRGKYVLVSFFSYQLEECIAENLQLKAYYNEFHQKGFEIYQINLDSEEDTWKSYLDYEDIPWISVREDDPTYLANARLFNVQTLPATYLFDKEGVCIATNLHDRNLKIKLDQLFN